MEEELMKKGWGAARGVAVGGGALGVFRGVGGGAVADDSEASGASTFSEEIF